MELWRNKLSADIKTHLEAQIKEVSRFKAVYLNEKDVKLIQLWLGIANLSKGIFDLNLKTNYIERALKDLSEINKSLANKVENITKIDFQKEINNTFTQISEINAKLKSIQILEKDSASIKERLIELTEKIKPLEKLPPEIEEIKRVRVTVLERVKELETKYSNIEKNFNSQLKEIERLKKVKVKPVVVKKKK